jgi:hypothetical protein
MPVKIKQKQTKKVEWVDIQYYETNIKNNDLYKTLYIKDIYELYNRKTGVELWQTTLEKNKAIEALHNHPDIFRIEYSKENSHRTWFFLLFDYMPDKMAEIILSTITSHAGSKAVKILSNLIKYVLIPVLVGLLILLGWFFIHPLLKANFKHD